LAILYEKKAEDWTLGTATEIEWKKKCPVIGNL
jgi:hypothetical protein